VTSYLTRRVIFLAVCLSIVFVPTIHRFAARAQDEKSARVAPQDRIITPAGKFILDASNGMPAIAPLTMNFVRTPDSDGPDGKGRYLIAVNSGWGIQQTSRSRGNQTLSIIDLNKTPDPLVVQNVWFPAPQSANFGLAFDQAPQPDGRYRLFVSGGFENKIWMLSYDPKAGQPISPKNVPDKPLDAPFIDVASIGFPASPNYNNNVSPVYPTGIALSPDGNTLYTANNLGDTLAVINDVKASKTVAAISLVRPRSSQFVYPYDVKLLTKSGSAAKIYVSLWGDGSIAVVNPQLKNRVTYIPVDRHPTLMIFI